MTVASAQDNEVLVSAGLGAGEKVVIESRGELTDGIAIAEKKL